MSESAPDPHDTTCLPRRFGDYDLLDEIGRGGMGVIYRARQRPLDRPCAVKMLRPDLPCCDPAGQSALRTEAAAAASLDHPNIVGIYEAGLEDGRQFFSMELVDGEDLARYVRSRLLSSRDIARIMARIAEAVAYAHGRGVLHHDLKPANVVIDGRGEPQITDFGLARRIDEAGRSDPAHGAGTPNYLAPEQASARFGEPGVATDVYGLGAILYFLLTDRPPFVGFTAEDTIRAVLESDPVGPRLVRPGVSLDLETTCLKCLGRQAVHRYASAREVADELQRFLRDEPIRARPTSLFERGRRWCRRHPALAVLGSTVGLLLALIAAGSSTAAFWIHQARQRAEASELETRRNLYDADLLLASSALESGKSALIREILDRHVSQSGRPDLRGWEWRFLRQATSGDVDAVVGRHSNSVYQVVWSRDDRWIAAIDIGGQLAVWDATRCERRAQRALVPVGAVRIASAHRHDWLLAASRPAESAPSTMTLLELPDLRLIREFPLSFREHAVGFSADDSRFWTLGETSLIARATDSGRETARYRIPRSRNGRDVAYSSASSRLAVADQSGPIHVFDLSDGSEILTLPGHPYQPAWGQATFSLAFAPDGRTLATSGGDGTVRLWQLGPPSERILIQGLPIPALSVAFLPDGRTVAATASDDLLLLSTHETNTPPVALRGAESNQAGLAIAADGRTAVTGGLDGIVRKWRHAPRPQVQWLSNSISGASVLLGLQDARHVAAITDDFGIAVSTVPDGRVVATQPGSPDLIAAAVEIDGAGRLMFLRMDRAGRLSFSGNSERSEPLDRQLPPTPDGSPRRNPGVTISPDGRFIAAGSIGEGLRILATTNGLPERAHLPEAPGQAVFSPRGTWFLSVGLTGLLKLRTAEGGPCSAADMSHPQVSNVAFSADERRLVSVGLNGTIHLWDVATGRELAHLRSSAGTLYAVAWSSDAARVFFGSLEGSISILDASTLRETFVSKRHARPVTGLFLTPEDSLVTLATDGICVWPAPRDDSNGRHADAVRR